MASSIALSSAVTSEIIEPIRTSGDEAALIFVPGGHYLGEQYKETAQAIQEASNLRLWVALTGGYTFNVATPFEIPSAIQGAIAALKLAGLKTENYVGLGHSEGGIFLGRYAKSETSQLKAVVVMGSLVSGSKLKDYPLPVMTLSAELDGEVRITRVVEDYEQLLQDVKTFTDAVYRTPVISIKGATHGQFGSRPFPPRVRHLNPKADLTDSEVHAEIGMYVNSFVTATFSSNTTEVKAAQAELQDFFVESGQIFQPLLDIKALHGVANSCPWAQVVQKHLAGEFTHRVEVDVEVLGRFTFPLSSPSIVKAEESVDITTTALISYEWNPLNLPHIKRSPKEIDLKLKSKAAIKQALESDPGSGEELEASCLSLNQLALEVAWNSSTAHARQRYNSRGRPIVFVADNSVASELSWAVTPSKYMEDKNGLHVQATTLKIPVSTSKNSGDLYCKVMAPYRALEWIVLDSFMPV